MRLTRREALICAGSALISGLSPRLGIASSAHELIASVGQSQLAPSQYPKTEIWGYNGEIPGPLIKVKRGENVRRKFVNKLPQSSTIHWHGIRIDNKMDGVPHLTQALVKPGGDFEYDFIAPDAGTYWYHPHNKTWEQMARGLYGPLIVEEDDPPEIDEDLTLLVDDWRLTQEARISDDFGSMMDWSHAGRLGNWVTVNGIGDYKRHVKKHQRIRLRLINVSNSRVFSLGWNGMRSWLLALDGQPVSKPAEINRIELAPAQRADLFVDITGEEGGDAFLLFQDREQSHKIASFTISAAMRSSLLNAPAPLSPNSISEIGNLKTAKKIDLIMEGGAMGRMRGAVLNGEYRNMRDLAASGHLWAFNNNAGLTEKPLAEIEIGQTVIMSIVNDTAWPHAMHLHGHHFRRLDKGGRLGPLRDTVLMERSERIQIAFVADNPGKWLFHCHMLEHSASGMITWLEVA